MRAIGNIHMFYHMKIKSTTTKNKIPSLAASKKSQVITPGPNWRSVARYDLCTRCLVDWYVVPGEVLFHAGPACDSMLFVVHGSIRCPARGRVAPGGFKAETPSNDRGLNQQIVGLPPSNCIGFKYQVCGDFSINCRSFNEHIY